jgi:hypothetical protein
VQRPKGFQDISEGDDIRIKLYPDGLHASRRPHETMSTARAAMTMPLKVKGQGQLRKDTGKIKMKITA